ncbi:hypothetical protein [Deinococcus navajonensis]|uniref:Uncharacterized protein n=1 Tax=Deinococcus navajonensis TaxID=309884 RepID=A0ABV8XL07_9DEIO
MIYDEYRNDLDAIELEIREFWNTEPKAPKVIAAGSATPAELRAYADAKETYDQDHGAWKAALNLHDDKKKRIAAEIGSRFAPTYLGEFAYLHSVISYPAYEKGHHAGTYEIELHYKDLAELVVAAARATLAHQAGG